MRDMHASNIERPVRPVLRRVAAPVPDVRPRAIAPHVPKSRDMVSLYAARMEQTGADVQAALRQRRATSPRAGEPIGYLSAPVPRMGAPVPVGRGTSTHRQALDAMAVSQWSTEIGPLPRPDRVRVTRAMGGIGRASAGRPGLVGRLAAAASAFHRPRPESGEVEPLRRLEPQRI